MNTFYFNDKTEKIEKVKPNNGYTFTNDYEEVRGLGNSIIDSIEWTK